MFLLHVDPTVNCQSHHFPGSPESLPSGDLEERLNLGSETVQAVQTVKGLRIRVPETCLKRGPVGLPHIPGQSPWLCMKFHDILLQSSRYGSFPLEAFYCGLLCQADAQCPSGASCRKAQLSEGSGGSEWDPGIVRRLARKQWASAFIPSPFPIGFGTRSWRGMGAAWYSLSICCQWVVGGPTPKKWKWAVGT